MRFHGAKFHGARFHGAKFHAARFHGARVVAPDFIGSRVSNKYPCPYISVYLERQTIVVTG